MNQMKLETAGRSMWRNFTEAKTEKCMITKKWRKRYQGIRDVNKDLTPKGQDKDKDPTAKDQDKDKDLTPKDQDKDKDLLDLTLQGQGQGPDPQGPGQGQGLEICP